MSNNFIYGLTADAGSTATSVYGIKANSGVRTYSNNIISLGGNTASTIYGIYDTGASTFTCNLYFNSVYIGGSLASGVTNKSYALYSAANSNTRDFRNNILSNARTTISGASLHYAAWFNYTTNGTLTLDYNDYFKSGTGGVLGRFNGADVNSKPLISGLDAHSVNADPLFLSAGGTSAVNYQASESTLTGITIAGVTTDYFAAARPATPTIGALEHGVITITGTLNAFTSCTGIVSANQSFTVSATSISSNITVTAPTGFELSETAGTGFSGSVTLNQSGGTVATTTIYVRITASASGSPSGNITFVASGSGTKNLSANGTVYPNLSAVELSPVTAQTICVTASGTQLTATETGGGAITARQWGKCSVSGGAITDITGANAQTYTPTGAGLGTGIWYLVCTTTPTCGSAIISNEVTITVKSNLSTVAVTPVTSQTICVTGSGSQLTVAETGGGTITARQWGKRSVSGGAITTITGATASTYTPSGSVLGSGTWFLVCTSAPSCGSAIISNEVTVTVPTNVTAGAIAVSGETICYNGNPALIGSTTAASGGDGNISYKWQANGTDISGATSVTFDPPAGVLSNITFTRLAKDGT